MTLGATELSLQNPEANNFQPAYGSEVIDASVNSLIERDQYAEVRETVGLGVTNVLAPTQDVSGVLRADHPDFASPGGIGALKVERAYEQFLMPGICVVCQAPCANAQDPVKQ